MTTSTPQVTLFNASTSGSLPTFNLGAEAHPPHTTEIHTLLAITDPTAISVDDRLREAASMIQVSGTRSDVLAQHRQRRGASSLPSQDRLQTFGDTVYPRPLQSAPSLASLPSTSQISQNISADTNIYYVKRGKRDEKLEEVVKYAMLALVNEMTLNAGWKRSDRRKARAQTVWKREITESVTQACVAVDFPHFVPTDHIEKWLVAGLTLFHSKMAAFAENYAKEFLNIGIRSNSPNHIPDYIVLQEHVRDITNPAVPERFFLHKQTVQGVVERLFGNPILERFHIEFWFARDTSPVVMFQSSYQRICPNMLAFSGVALLCALHRVSQGRCSSQSDVIEFVTKSYVDHFHNYKTGILDALAHDVFGSHTNSRLEWLNNHGHEEMRCWGLAAQPRIAPMVIPTTMALTAQVVPSSAPGIAGPSSGAGAEPSSASAPFFEYDYSFGVAGSSSSGALDGSPVGTTFTAPFYQHFDGDL